MSSPKHQDPVARMRTRIRSGSLGGGHGTPSSARKKRASILSVETRSTRSRTFGDDNNASGTVCFVLDGLFSLTADRLVVPPHLLELEFQRQLNISVCAHADPLHSELEHMDQVVRGSRVIVLRCVLALMAPVCLPSAHRLNRRATQIESDSLKVARLKAQLEMHDRLTTQACAIMDGFDRRVRSVVPWLAVLTYALSHAQRSWRRSSRL